MPFRPDSSPMRSQMSSEGLFDGELAGVFGRLLTAPSRLPWYPSNFTMAEAVHRGHHHGCSGDRRFCVAPVTCFMPRLGSS